MEFMVGFTYIIWFLVAIVAFGTLQAQTGADTAEKSREKEQQP